MVTNYQAVRVSCGISQRELACALNICYQRLSQVETRYLNRLPKNRERYIIALEELIAERKEAIERAEYIFKHERDTLFDPLQEGEAL